MPDVNIKITTTNDDRGVKNSIGSFTELNSAIGVVSKVMQVAKKAYDETIGVTMKYAEEVRNLSLATGAGAEEASRFLQVMDDFQVSASDVTAGMRAMKEKGLVPTIDTLAQLSDQFLAIEDPAKRLQFAQDNLGRSSAKYLNVLSKGGDAIRSMSDGVSENLILTERQIKQTEEYRLKVDALQDTLLGFKVAATLAFFDAADAQQKAANTLLVYTGNLAEANLIMRGHTGRVAEVVAEYTRAEQYGAAWASALEGEVIPAVEELTAANTDMLSLIQNLQSETDRYNETAIELHGSQDQLRQDYVDGKVSAEEYKSKMGELTGAVKANQQAHEEAGKKIAFSLLTQKLAVDGLRDAEFDALLDIGVQWGIMDQTTINSARIMDDQLDAIDKSFKDPISKMTQANEKLHALQNMAGQMWTYYVNIETSGSFPNFPGPNNNQSGPGVNAGVGYQSGFATGGSFVIPSWYGNEGFSMGGMATASGGELVTITPKGQKGASGFANYGTINVYANNAEEFMMSMSEL